MCLSFTITLSNSIAIPYVVVNSKIVSMIKKYHNHKLQITPWHCEEESQSNEKTPGRQTKQSNQQSLAHQDDRKTSIGH